MSEKKPRINFGGHSEDAVLMAKAILPKTEEYAELHSYDMNERYRSDGEKLEEVRARWKRIGRAVIDAVLIGEFGDIGSQGEEINFSELSKVRAEKRKYDRHFYEPLRIAISEGLSKNPEDIARQEAAARKMMTEAIDIGGEGKSKEELRQYFPSGNWLYHGVLGGASSGSSKILSIFKSGALKNGKALHESSSDARLHGGYEGISWSMNGIDAFPGDRYHAAGFLAAPETILADGEQLAVPSKPAVFEVQQLSAEVNMAKLWDAKKQRGVITSSLGRIESMPELEKQKEENNLSSALAHIVAVNQGRSKDGSKVMSWLEQHQSEDAGELLRMNPSGRRAYRINEDGVIRFDPNIRNYADANTPPVGARYIQAAIDTGRLEKTEFNGKSAAEIIATLNDQNIRQFISAVRVDTRYWLEKMNEQQDKVTAVEASVEDMIFVCAKSDLGKWARAIATSGHMPKRIVTYDDQKIRLADWKQRYSDGEKLSEEIDGAIGENSGHISYDEVLGETFDNSMRSRARGKHGSIAEKYLKKTRAIIKENGTLSWRKQL